MSVASAFWRRLAYAGARYGPTPWVRYSPPLFGLAFGAALPEVRRVVRDNLRAALGPRPRLTERADVAKTFIEFAHCLAESLASERPEARHAVRRAEGRVLLREALNEGRGVIIATAHVGVWDAAAQLLAGDLGADVMVVMRPETDPRARGLHDAVRERRGLTVLHVGDHPLDAMPLLRHLRQGGVVAIQLDRASGGGDDLAARLFGRRFPIPRGPFLLSSMTGAPLVPLFCSRLGYFDYHVHIAPPIRLPRRASVEEQLEGACRFTSSLEAFIRLYPTQWFHFGGIVSDEAGSTSPTAAGPVATGSSDPSAEPSGSRLKTPRPAEGDSL